MKPKSKIQKCKTKKQRKVQEKPKRKLGGGKVQTLSEKACLMVGREGRRGHREEVQMRYIWYRKGIIWGEESWERQTYREREGQKVENIHRIELGIRIHEMVAGRRGRHCREKTEPKNRTRRKYR